MESQDGCVEGREAQVGTYTEVGDESFGCEYQVEHDGYGYHDHCYFKQALDNKLSFFFVLVAFFLCFIWFFLACFRQRLVL